MLLLTAAGLLIENFARIQAARGFHRQRIDVLGPAPGSRDPWMGPPR